MWALEIWPQIRGKRQTLLHLPPPLSHRHRRHHTLYKQVPPRLNVRHSEEVIVELGPKACYYVETLTVDN